MTKLARIEFSHEPALRVLVTDFDDYKKFLVERIRLMPKNGRGQFKRLASLLNVHPTMITHVFKEDAHLSPEQALRVARYLTLNESECEYFLLLVLHNRSSDFEARQYFQSQMQSCRERIARLPVLQEPICALSEAELGVFFSTWHYSAIYLLVSIEGGKSAKAVGASLRLPPALVESALAYLISAGLCTKEGENYSAVSRKFSVKRQSPLGMRHHINWRSMVAEEIVRFDESDLVYSCPVLVSKSDFPKIREKLLQIIADFRQISEPSDAEHLCCLNIDWVRVGMN